ncbi:MAG: ATP-binding cassette domain-containing protein [Ignavibacteriae bacterium]|nr:ATP-binding cassette domain-containing protein [Ignavibacteriota bacterium]NOG96762.1 ATP-binding cassette domain-containing protein [Ignavibacteriota bacterium]
MKQSILRCVNISYSVYNSTRLKNEQLILKDISFNVKKNSIFGIVGESGSGKTTLGKIICGILKPVTGEILFNNNSQINSRVQFLFQNSVEIVNPLRKVSSILIEALMIKSNKSVEDRLGDILTTLGLEPEILSKYSFQLSGGERQRIALGRILAIEPEIIILDEPFSAQDVQSQLNLYRLLLRLKKESDLTIICISHNIFIMQKIADEILVIKDGAVVEVGSGREIFNSPKSSFTNYLIKASKMELEDSEILSI